MGGRRTRTLEALLGLPGGICLILLEGSDVLHEVLELGFLGSMEVPLFLAMAVQLQLCASVQSASYRRH